MLNSFSKVLVVVAMLIAFVGQALANTSMSCEMSAKSHQPYMAMDQSTMDHSTMDHSSMEHASMDHGGMNHSMMNNSDTQSHEECCGADCACPVSACSTLSIVSSVPSTAVLARLSEGVMRQQTNQTKSISSSLFRPPIIA
ncbi:hypothetical protein [Thalassotalea fusca]